MIRRLRRAFVKPGAYRWQWLWSSWWHLWPHFSFDDDIIDYGMAEYGGGPSYQVNVFAFSCFEAMWYSDLSTGD